MIRPALPADRARIETIVDAAYRPYLQRMNRPPAPMVDNYVRRIAAGQAYVLEQDGEIMGLLVLEPAEDHLLLDNIAVDPAQHGQGLGKRLMAFTEEEARRQGYDRVLLYTNEVMLENIALYRRLDYVEVKRVRAAGYNRVYLRKEL